jgi:hypothetical protein
MATQTDLNTISDAIDSALSIALTGGKPSNIVLITPPTPDVNTITATAALTSYVQRCGNNVTDTKNLYKFIKGCVDLGVWNNIVCWPMRLGQNAVTGNTVYSLGGLGIYNGTINGTILKTLSGNLYAANALITTTFNIGYSATTCGYFGTAPTTNSPTGGKGNMFAATDLTNTYSFYWLNPRSGFGNEFKFLDSNAVLTDNTLSGFNSWIGVGQAGVQTKGYINSINTVTSSTTAIPVSSIPNYTLSRNLIIGRDTGLYSGTLTLPFILNTALPSLSVTAFCNLYKTTLGQDLNLP